MDISYGGRHGFNQAIDLASDVLTNVKFSQERKLIKSYFEQIATESEKVCFGLDETMYCLELGAIETLICWENLEAIRYIVRQSGTEATSIKFAINDKIELDVTKDCELEEKIPLLEWLADNYTSYGSKLELITDASEEGSQFVNGFGGLGAILRYRVQMPSEWANDGTEEDEFNLDDY